MGKLNIQRWRAFVIFPGLGSDMLNENNILAHWHLEHLQSWGPFGDPSLGNMLQCFWRGPESPGGEGRMVARGSRETWGGWGSLTLGSQGPVCVWVWAAGGGGERISLPLSCDRPLSTAQSFKEMHNRQKGGKTARDKRYYSFILVLAEKKIS